MARLPDVMDNGFSRIKNSMDSELYLDDGIDNGIDYVDDNSRIKVNPKIAKDAIKSILLSEIGEYVKGAFSLTCENISNLIDKNNAELLDYTQTKIEKTSEILAEKLTTRLIEEQLIDKIVDKVIDKLSDNMLDKIIANLVIIKERKS